MHKTILLVDDLPMYIEIEKEFLQDTHVGILTANDGLEALNIVKSTRPDIVFMDLEMPMIDGATCCQAIKSDPAIANVPVIMVTSKGNEEKCYSAGCDHFLAKPLDRLVFLNAARQFIPDIDRREKRTKINADGFFRVHEETVRCHFHDLSIGGTFVVTNYPAVAGSVVHVSFTLPDGTHIVDCSSRVTWVNGTGSDHPKGFGVRFALMEKSAASALNNFLKSVK